MTPAPAPGLARIEALLAPEGLCVLGAFHPGAGDGTPAGTGTLALVGPSGPGFWSHVTAAPEFADGRADPLDRWSRRVIDRIARLTGGVARYPFAGPPWAPFNAWALRSGWAFRAPVGLLVHPGAGLWLSFRGALALRARLALPPPPARSPCADCATQPCATGCPVGALGAQGYDVAACRDHLDRAAGAECLNGGCAARRACPISAAQGRDPAQSAFHMRHFHGDAALGGGMT